MRRGVFAVLLALCLPVFGQLYISNPFFVAGVLKPAAGGVPDPTILWWKLNDAPGTAINADAGPDGTTDGTLNNDHLALNGTSQEASTDAAITTTGIEIVTVTWWQQASSWNHGAANTAVDDGFTQNGGFTLYEQSGVYNFGIYHSGGTRNESASTANLPTGEYVNFAVILDNSTVAGNVIAYTNGVEMPLTVDIDTKGGSGDIRSGTVYVGAIGGTSSWAGGEFDDVRIYSGALSSAQITAIKNAGRQ